MEWIAFSVIMGLVGLLAWQAWRMDLERDKHRAHVERLERMLRARDAGEAAALERVFASPQPPVKKEPVPPSEEDQMWAEPPPRRE